jgi:membrane-associated phospholipid phosphatase
MVCRSPNGWRRFSYWPEKEAPGFLYMSYYSFGYWCDTDTKAFLLRYLPWSVLGFTDFTNSKLLKTAFNRPRPCQTMDPDTIHLRIACGSGKSFPSSHAANHMAFAMFFYLIFRSESRSGWVYFLFPWAALIGFSQVFVGVHYPFDILAGFLYGGAYGFCFLCTVSSPVFSQDGLMGC